VVSDGPYGYEAVNVDTQRGDPGSLLLWFERMLRSLRECPEAGTGTFTLLSSGIDHVLAVRFDAATGAFVTLTNLRDKACTVDLAAEIDAGELFEVFGNRPGADVVDASSVPLDGWGYRWFRLR
jgi:maltose alpha-D-glucosyltransferase/alpha-amylase